MKKGVHLDGRVEVALAIQYRKADVGPAFEQRFELTGSGDRNGFVSSFRQLRIHCQELVSGQVDGDG